MAQVSTVKNLTVLYVYDDDSMAVLDVANNDVVLDEVSKIYGG